MRLALEPPAHVVRSAGPFYSGAQLIKLDFDESAKPKRLRKCPQRTSVACVWDIAVACNTRCHSGAIVNGM